MKEYDSFSRSYIFQDRINWIWLLCGKIEIRVYYDVSEDE